MELNKLLETAIRASLEAGQDILNIYNDPSQDFGIEKKSDNSPLTLADKASHRCIMRYLESLGIPVLSEEGKHLPFEIRQQWNELWVVDPLDGTKEFIKKNGEFTVNIALVRENDPIMGVIYVPVKETLYYGYRDEEGSYAFKAIVSPQASVEEVLQKSTPIPLQHPEDEIFRVVASRSHMSPETLAYIVVLVDVFQVWCTLPCRFVTLWIRVAVSTVALRHIDTLVTVQNAGLQLIEIGTTIVVIVIVGGVIAQAVIDLSIYLVLYLLQKGLVSDELLFLSIG